MNWITILLAHAIQSEIFNADIKYGIMNPVLKEESGPLLLFLFVQVFNHFFKYLVY